MIESLEQRFLLSGYGLNTIVSFGMGANPHGTLTSDASGNLYGTTYGGGAYGGGTVFKISEGSSTIKTIASFNDFSRTGVHPLAGVTVDSSGNLYGTTLSGGQYRYGTVFEIAKDTGTIRVIASFNKANGANPHGGMTLDSIGNLYGTTYQGGAYGYGTVFEIARGTGTIRTIASFTQFNAYPESSVSLDGSRNLFGTTAQSYGTVFEIAHDTGTIQTVASFHGADGSRPCGGVTLDGSGNLYGTSLAGGATGHGTVFKIPSGTHAIQTLASFDGSNGAAPYAGVTLDAEGNLYGTTQDGGSSQAGTVFKIPHDTNMLQTVASFNGSDGASLSGGIALDASGNLHGTTMEGGAHGYGTVFEIPSGSTVIQTLASFNGSNGAYSDAGVVLDGSGNLYGTTAVGGVYGEGTIFEIANGTGTIRTLASFNVDISAGGPVHGGVTLDGSGDLYGTTYQGGAYGDGTVFELTPGSNTIQTLVSFAVTNGREPASIALDASGNLYGTALYGGSSDVGTVFEIPAGTNTIQTLASFDTTHGAVPAGPVALDSSGNLYGTTYQGGAYGYGTVFEIPSGSHTIETLASFDGSSGGDPRGATLDRSGNLYGTTGSGGSDGVGTVFKLAHGSRNIETLASFIGSSSVEPAGVALDDRGNIFGTTAWGGTYGGGTVFEIASGTHVIQTLASFDGSNGAAPAAGVALDRIGNLYGTTKYGGLADCGTTFKLSPPVPGDVNGDRSVNFADLLILAQHYGQAATPDQGDLDENGTVGFDDLLILAQNYGRNEPAGWSSPTPTAAPGTLPDPGDTSVPRRRTRAALKHRSSAPSPLAGRAGLGRT